MATEHKIRHDVSIIPDFEQRLSYWSSKREADTEPESDIEIIFCEEIECAFEYLSIVSVDASQSDTNVRLDQQYDLLNRVRGIIEDFAPGGLEAYNEHVAQARERFVESSTRLARLQKYFGEDEA